MKYKLEKFDDLELVDIQNTMFITLLLTQGCNANCWYCDVKGEDKQQTRYITVDDAKKIADFIDRQVPKTPNLVVHFFGGEPTLNKDLIKIAELFKKRFGKTRNLDLLITTNLLRHEDEIHDDMLVAASYHSDWVKDDWLWFAKAKILWNYLQLYHVVLMLQKNNKEKIYRLYKEYKDQMPCIIAPITQYIDDPDYLEFKDKVVTELGENPFDDSEAELFFDKGKMGLLHMCRSGIIIDEFGDVYTCWNQFNKRSHTNIFLDPLVRFPLWHVCDHYTENCDMEVPRASISYYRKHIMCTFPCPKGKEYSEEELKEYKSKKILFRCNA